MQAVAAAHIFVEAHHVAPISLYASLCVIELTLCCLQPVLCMLLADLMLPSGASCTFVLLHHMPVLSLRESPAAWNSQLHTCLTRPPFAICLYESEHVQYVACLMQGSTQFHVEQH